MERKEFEEIYRNFKPVTISLDNDNIIRNLFKKWDQFEKIQAEQEKKRILSINEALEDVEHFFILLKYCYSGYDYYKRNIDFMNIKNSIIASVNKFEKIDNLKLMRLLCEELVSYINDGHFEVVVCNDGYRFWKPYFAYVTDIIVEESNKDYFEVVKGDELLKKGTIINKCELEGKLLKTLPNNNKDRYLIGSYSEHEIEEIVVNDVKLATHIIKADQYANEPSGFFDKIEEYKNYNIYFNRSYVFQSNDLSYVQESKYSEFRNNGLKCKDKNITIWDVSGNHGGNSEYPRYFIKGLNSYANWQSHTAVITGPYINQNNTNKKSYIMYDDEDLDLSKATYEGDLYVVINKEVASSGEAAVSFGRSCKNVKVVGSATAGVGLFGDVLLYQLKNSKIAIVLPYKIFFEDGFKEGKGFVPDYWIDSENPVEELIKYLNFDK